MVADRSGQNNGRSRSGSRHALLEWAQAYGRLDWCIIPVRQKLPAGRWKQYQKTRPDDATLRKLFEPKNLTGLAVILGPVSGRLACRDFDQLGSYESWSASHRQLAATLPTAETARGRHV